MARPLWAICSLLMAATSVRAGLVVTLTPDVFPPNPGGTYNPGQSLDLDVWLMSDIALDVRLMQFDHTSSSPELMLGSDRDIGRPVYDPTPENPFDGVPNFHFDYASLADPNSYTDFSNLSAGAERKPWPAAAVFTDLEVRVGNMLGLQPGVPFHAGTMPVTMPVAPGEYMLDLLNAGTTDRNRGALLVFGGLDGSPTTTWSSMDDGDVEINYAPGGGPAVFAVVPEPATLLLLAMGGVAAMERSRRQIASTTSTRRPVDPPGGPPGCPSL